ncbi:MAG: tetratricopeptide repeat protein [Pyrinomonadaceae bacterium]
MKIAFLVLTACLCAFTPVARGQASAITPEMRAEANGYYQAGDWAKAAAAYEKLVALDKASSGPSYRLGNSLLNLGRAPEALPYLEHALMAAPNPIFALTAARAYAMIGNKPKSLEALDKAVPMGGLTAETLNGQKEFAGWKGDKQFNEVVAKLDLAANPCKAPPEFRQFDFWIGEWDVKTPQGGIAGTSSVQLILGQCTIFENWTGGAGSSGKSFNIYDVNDKKWHQTWVSDKGVFTHYFGGLQDGSMVIVADTMLAGKKALAKMTFSKLPNGDVRQFGENSADEGKTWTTSFDLIYSKKKK